MEKTFNYLLMGTLLSTCTPLLNSVKYFIRAFGSIECLSDAVGIRFAISIARKLCFIKKYSFIGALKRILFSLSQQYWRMSNLF